VASADTLLLLAIFGSQGIDSRCSSGSELVAMLQAAEPRYGDDFAPRAYIFLLLAAGRRLFVQAKIYSFAAVVSPSNLFVASASEM
jgi:hypothetical protein